MTFKIFWSEEDQGFVCVVPDLPGCCAVGDSRQEAAEAISDAIIAWKESESLLMLRIAEFICTFARTTRYIMLIVNLPLLFGLMAAIGVEKLGAQLWNKSKRGTK